MTSADGRGNRILEIAARLELVVISQGNTSTFRGAGCEGTITNTSERLVTVINNWQVLDDLPASDHQYIQYTPECKGEKPHLHSGLSINSTQTFNTILVGKRKLTKDSTASTFGKA